MNRADNGIFSIKNFNDDSEFFNIGTTTFAEIISRCENCPIIVTKLIELDTIHKEYNTERSERFVVKVVYIKENKEHMINFFIKKSREKNPHEAINYLHLHKCDAPIPKLYAYYSEANESDIIITEVVNPLHDVGSDFMLREDVFKPFIVATAEFNSVKIDNEYKAFLSQRWDIVSKKIVRYKEKLENIFAEIHEQEKYKKYRQDFSKKLLDTLLTLHDKLCNRIIPMEQGLYHWDHSPYNSGWSVLQNKHIIFDLEMTLWAPRFMNIGRWIGGNEKSYTTKEKLGELYLSIYNQRLSTNVSLDNLLHECYPLWLAEQFQNVIWGFRDLSDYDEKKITYVHALANAKI